MIYLNQVFFKISKQVRKFYLNSKSYDKKISKIDYLDLKYKPSPYLLSSLIKYEKKFKIEDFSYNELWIKNDINKKEFKKLNSFYWFLSLDLKSSKKTTQSIINNWIKNNYKYNSQSWEFDITSKRIIAWLSSHNLTFEDGDQEYKSNFNSMVQKQTNHLINEINNSDLIDDKIIGCAAIILVGLCYEDQKNYLPYGLNLLKKISKFSLDNSGFPKSRSIKQLILYLKYFVLIREWFKESQISVPEHIDETIYYLGQGYAFLWQNIGLDILFNGNNNSNNSSFDNYLKRLGYKFKNENKDFAGYLVLNNKKTYLIMDIGSSPNTKFSKDYQSGALSIEIISNGKKLISNCGYYKKENSKLNKLSKTTATQSTLVINDYSSCNFNKVNNSTFLIKKGLKILKKDTVFEKDYWKVTASHDGYLKDFNLIHEREIEFYPKKMMFIGTDKIIYKKINKKNKFDIRFHLEPNIKLMKTQDNKTILIELDDEGWKFTCNKFDINIDNGLYFGKKNTYLENQNIFISGISKNQNENITWELTKI